MSQKGIDTLLAEHAVFAGLPDADIKFIAGCAENVKFDAGEYLFHDGGEANHFFLLRYGQVAIQVYAPGKGSLTVATFSQGDIVGWSWLFPPYRWHFDAKATDLVRAVSFDGTCLRRKTEDNPALGHELMKRFARLIVDRLEATQLQLLDLYADQPVSR